MSTRLLSPEDIYDVYGLDWVLQVNLDPEDRQFVNFRLNQIQDAYVHAAKSRIKAEAGFLGIDDADNLSFSSMLGRIKDHLATAVQDSMMANAERMQRGGGFNLMGEILKAHQKAGRMPVGIDPSKFGVKVETPQPRPDVDPNWFMKGNSGRVVEDPKWAEIARAYLGVEAAKDSREIVQAIDRLNQLQHNSFHVLIDLQTGRMLNDYSNATNDRDARKNLQEILDIKLKARSPSVFASSMSKEVRDILHKYRGATG
jgi:hypothetical protein